MNTDQEPAEIKAKKPICPKCGKEGTCTWQGDIEESSSHVVVKFTFLCSHCSYTDSIQLDSGSIHDSLSDTLCPYCGIRDVDHPS